MISLVTLVLAANNPFLAEGLQHEKDLDFEKCVQRLKQAATQWKNDADEVREIELHAGLCQFNLGDRKAAMEHFRVALRIELSTELPAYTSPKAVELFMKVKKSLEAQAPPMRDEDLLAEDKDPPKDAPKNVKLEPPVVTGPSPVVAFLSHRAVPLSLGAISIGAAITGAILGARATTLATEANAARFESDFYRLGADATGSATGATIAWILAGTSAIGAVLTWWLMGETPPAAATP